MSRFSRDQKHARRTVTAARPVPVEVHVPASGGATVGGTPVPETPGEAVHISVLNYLHHLTRSTGHPVHATVRDERIGFVVPIQVSVDGASTFTGEPLRVPGPPRPPGPLRTEHQASRSWTADPQDAVPAAAVRETAMPTAVVPEDALPETAVPETAVRATAVPAVPETAVREQGGADGKSGRRDVATFALRALPEPGTAATRNLSAVPESAAGEPPRVALAAQLQGAVAAELGELAQLTEPVKPTPARGFDAVAEAVLEPTDSAEQPALLAEPVARINEAVRNGQIEAAAALAEQTVGSASQSIGEEHPEVLRLRELTAYIAYLAGDAARSFHLSLELARVCRRRGDTQAAYGNIQSAASAWRAVRDPEQGLNLGHDLIHVWSELAAEDGPAAEDIDQLDSARSRMTRLAERARVHADNPYARDQ